MLSIKLIGSSKQEVGYYADLGEDYYVDGGEPPGTWWGEGAKELGLSGTVRATEFRNVLEGKSKDGSKRLVQNAGKPSRRAAFDLTFSVPKSVSIARAIGSTDLAKKIDVACDAASRKAFESVQELCGSSRRGSAGHRGDSAKLVAAVFRHETARGLNGNVPDPNLHYHFVLCNVCVREDGTTGTFDGRLLFRRQMKMALGALFRAELSKQLQALGLETYRPETGQGKPSSWFELKSVPKKVIEVFSKRREQIVAWLEKNGQSGAKAAERAALSTREAKSCYSRQQLKRAWRSLAQKLGFDSTSIHRSGEVGHNSGTELERAIERGLQKVTHERGHFTETDLLRHAAQEAQCKGVGAKQVISAVQKTLANDTEIVHLQSVGGEPRFTTTEILEIEKRLFESAKRSADCPRHAITNEQLAETVESHPTLKPEQSEATRHITARPGRIQCVNGMAGTGKTYMLRVAHDAWKAAGLNVVGTALAAKAAEGLQEGSGIESTHIHRLLWEVENGKRMLSERTVLVVDEAGMIGTRMMERLVALTESTNTKLVLVGDHRQLQAIEFGAPFRGLAGRIGVAELKEITRQREKWARTAVSELAAGNAESALERFAKRGLIKIAEDRERAIEHLVSDWKKEFLSGTDARIFAGTRLETVTVNRVCQRELDSEGKLSEQSIKVGRYEFHVGDSVVVTKNNAALLLRNGTQGRIVGFDAQRNELSVMIERNLTVRVNVDIFPHLELGYCTTTHKGQGQTVESAFVLVGGPMTDREISYVQGSRARENTRFYADKVNGGSSIQELAEQMSKSRRKDLVHDYTIEGA
ncbi:MAG: MobF family relaxase [Planctomycetota bacterium]